MGQCTAHPHSSTRSAERCWQDKIDTRIARHIRRNPPKEHAQVKYVPPVRYISNGSIEVIAFYLGTWGDGNVHW